MNQQFSLARRISKAVCLEVTCPLAAAAILTVHCTNLSCSFQPTRNLLYAHRVGCD